MLMRASRRWGIRLPALCLAGCLALVLGGCSLLPKEEAPLKPPLVKPVKENMEIYEVKRSNIVRQVKGSAVFASDNMQYLYFSESGGRLSSMDVRVGSVVKEGDVLAKLDQGELDSKIKQQQIVIEKAKIALEQVKQEKRGDVQAIRLKMLDIQKEQVQLELLQGQLDKTVLTSPISGIVTYIDSLQQGDPIAAYKPIVTVSDPKTLKLVYEVPNGNDLASIQIGMKAEIKYRNTVLQGSVMQIPATAPLEENKAIADKNAKSVVIVVEGSPEEAAIGSSAEVSIILEKRDNVIVIPIGGLRTYLNRDFVQVLEGESRKEIDVEKGVVSQTEVEIRSGLKEGQKVILNY